MALLGLFLTRRQRGIPLSAIATTAVGRCTKSAHTATIGRRLLIRAASTPRATCTSTMAVSTPQTTKLAATGTLCVVSESNIHPTRHCFGEALITKQYRQSPQRWLPIYYFYPFDASIKGGKRMTKLATTQTKSAPLNAFLGGSLKRVHNA